MKKELEDQLFEKYPKLFPDGKNTDITISLMQWGICTKDGWYDIIEILNLVWGYEEKSYKICEVCGKKGKLRTKMWYKVRCDEHENI